MLEEQVWLCKQRCVYSIHFSSQYSFHSIIVNVFLSSRILLANACNHQRMVVANDGCIRRWLFWMVVASDVTLRGVPNRWRLFWLMLMPYDHHLLGTSLKVTSGIVLILYSMMIFLYDWSDGESVQHWHIHLNSYLSIKICIHIHF